MVGRKYVEACEGLDMKRFALAVQLKDDADIIKRYEEYHAHPWPEVVEGTIACGVRRVYIYRYSRQLFMFMETDDDFDMERDMPKYMLNAKAREWDEIMRNMQIAIEGAPQSSRWVTMKEIYSLEADTQPHSKASQKGFAG